MIKLKKGDWVEWKSIMQDNLPIKKIFLQAYRIFYI